MSRRPEPTSFHHACFGDGCPSCRPPRHPTCWCGKRLPLDSLAKDCSPSCAADRAEAEAIMSAPLPPMPDLDDQAANANQYGALCYRYGRDDGKPDPFDHHPSTKEKP